MFKNLIDIERIEGNFTTEYYNYYYAKEYVKKRKNVFADKTVVSVVYTYPPVIREITTFKSKKQYWYWVFYPDEIIIYQFSKKPTTKEYEYMMKEISEEKRSKDIHTYYCS